MYVESIFFINHFVAAHKNISVKYIFWGLYPE